MDDEKLVSAVTDSFEFDDPADPEPITKANLVNYMPVWPEKATALGGSLHFEIIDIPTPQLLRNETLPMMLLREK